MLSNIKSIFSRVTINQARSTLAPYWRRLIVISVSLLGLALFFGAEYGLGNLIAKGNYLFAIGAIIVIAILFVTFAYPFWGYAIWFFLSMYLNLFNYIVPASFSFDLNMLGLLTLALIFRTLFKRESLDKLSIEEVFLILYFVYAYIIRHEFDTSHMVAEAKYLFISPLFFYFIAKNIIREKKHIYWFMLVIIVTGVSFALMGIYVQLTGKMWLAGLLGGDREIGLRSTGPAGNYYVYGNMLVITVLLCLHLFKWQNKWYSKSALVISSLVSLVGLYFGYSRAPYVAFAVSLLIMLILSKHTRRVYAVFTVIVLLSALIIIPIISNKTVQARMEANTWDVRGSFNKTSMNMFKANYWFGVGRGKYNDAVPKYMAPGHLSMKRPFGVNYQYSRPHSEYYLMLAELGIIGFLTYFIMYLLFLIMFMKFRGKLPQNEVAGSDFASLAIAFTIAVLLTMITDQFGDFPYMYVIMFTVFAMVKKAEFLTLSEKSIESI